MSVRTDMPVPGILRLLIDRPDARNAINANVRIGLIDAATTAQANPAIRALVIAGAGGMFSAGGDLPSLVGISEDAALARLREGHRLVSLLWTYPKPVVAAVERFAIGAGAGLALLSDEIVIGQKAVFGFPFIRLGLVPDWGLSGTVPRRAGAEAAAKLFATGGNVAADRALALGLADQVVEDARVMEEAVARAEALARLAPGAFARLKRRLRGDAEQVLQLDREARDQAACLMSSEFAEGYAAFREKREPRF
ncbi:MAG: enoyl-CoA hydratase/isomerase family protein [Sphingomonas sp.]|jgi:2-(1,2-epoxy-1,2-dihydrophenyl)acetyl-CoA isomerase|uniref:enoyl-CoA hydratase/isomerase family protein n=1 Tax=Sphingomonas sp. TaxID=28214 RepID=UPI0035659078